MKILIENQYVWLKPGDRVIRTKGGVLSRHHGLYVGNGIFAENQVNVGVRYAYYEDFIGPGIPVKVERFQGNQNYLQQVLKRVESLVGHAYDLRSYNCEHFVNHALTGDPKSTQIEVANLLSGGLIVGGVVAAATGRPKLAVGLVTIGLFAQLVMTLYDKG